MGVAAAAAILVNVGRLFVWFVAAAVTLVRSILRAELSVDSKGGDMGKRRSGQEGGVAASKVQLGYSERSRKPATWKSLPGGGTYSWTRVRKSHASSARVMPY